MGWDVKVNESYYLENERIVRRKGVGFII